MVKIISLFVALLASAASAVEWRNVDDEHHLGGRKASSGYLQGKVVLVDRWGAKCPPCRAMLPRVEDIWQNFKSKPFVVIGGHCEGWGGAEAVRDVIADAKLTYPVYEGAGLADGEPPFTSIPFLYVVDETGKVVYRGHDERIATQAIVMALTDMESPRNLQQWKRFLDFELEALPGRAYLRMDEFKKKFPAEVWEYREKFAALAAVPDVKKLAELVEFARKAKDMRAFDAKQTMQKQKFARLVEAALTKYAFLRDSPDRRVAQEAKNSLADLKWVQVTL